MEGLSKQRTLADLQARIEKIEHRAPLAETSRRVGKWGDTGFAVPPGMLHEIFTDIHANAGSVLGFALAGASRLLSSERPAIIILQLVRDGQNDGLPYGPGLVSFGIDPACVVLCRPETLVELLWAAEEAIACRPVAAVIADIGHATKGLDFTSSRRLSLRTAASGSTIFMIRYGREREASAARFRWRIEPVLSGEMPFDARAPGHSRWQVQLEKGRLGSKRDPAAWVLDWTGNGFALVDPQRKPAALAPSGAALPGPLPAALGNRLSQAS